VPWRGYATRLDGDRVEVVPDSSLSSKNTVRSYAEASTPDKLWGWGSNGNYPLFLQDIFLGEIPSEKQLRAYYVRKHGNLRGLNWLFPHRIQNPAAIEWVEEQLQQQRADLYRESGLTQLQDNLRRTEDQMAAKKEAVLSKREYAIRPEPVDYGLTYDDVHLSVGIERHQVDDGLQYKKGRRWFSILGGWKFFLAIWLVTYAITFALVSSNIGAVREFFNVSRPYSDFGQVPGREVAARTRLLITQSYSRSHDAVIRVSDEADNVIETYDHKGDF